MFKIVDLLNYLGCRQKISFEGEVYWNVLDGEEVKMGTRELRRKLLTFFDHSLKFSSSRIRRNFHGMNRRINAFFLRM